MLNKFLLTLYVWEYTIKWSDSRVSNLCWQDNIISFAKKIIFYLIIIFLFANWRLYVFCGAFHVRAKSKIQLPPKRYGSRLQDNFLKWAEMEPCLHLRAIRCHQLYPKIRVAIFRVFLKGFLAKYLGKDTNT